MLQAGAANSFSPNSAVGIAPGATLALNGFSQTIAGLQGAGSVTLGAGTLTDNAATSATYSGVISGTGGLTKAGSGTLTLSGANTYSGTTTVNAGVLQAGAANTFSPNSAVLSNGGTLDLNAFNQTIAGLNSGTDSQGNITPASAGAVTLGTGISLQSMRFANFRLRRGYLRQRRPDLRRQREPLWLTCGAEAYTGPTTQSTAGRLGTINGTAARRLVRSRRAAGSTSP